MELMRKFIPGVAPNTASAHGSGSQQQQQQQQQQHPKQQQQQQQPEQQQPKQPKYKLIDGQKWVKPEDVGIDVQQVNVQHLHGAVATGDNPQMLSLMEHLLTFNGV
ncbi:hypothetical protein OEZ85_003106 [Tetradesmus obliquus]|uniref:Uncharacterized protein n=1 Tax=Tetradesmus obliquus TaxID=3088 RepID=A0ABY8TZP1_TETOB|nr:hypothetical protein OEZ85_003106 [Tetradesmus obliquus]